MDIITYDELTTQVGGKTDTADASGSLHAKVADAKASLMAEVDTRQKPRGISASTHGSIQINQSAYTTPSLYVTGIKGKLVYLKLSSTSSGSHSLRLTFDGVVYFNGVVGSNAGTFWPLDAGAALKFLPQFTDSIKIEVLNSSGYDVTAEWIYEKEM